MTKPFLEAGEDRFLIARLDIDHATGRKSGLRDRRREQIRPGHAPQHLAALVQLWRTQMLPVLYLVIITALLVLLWLLVRKCLASRSGAVVARVLSVLLCAALAVGCVWAQQGLTALDSMTSGLLTGAEANKITKEPFVVYLSGVDNRGELTEKARSDVNILAVVNPTTKQAALINTPRDYYVDLAGTDSKDKLTHAVDT